MTSSIFLYLLVALTTIMFLRNLISTVFFKIL
nr:MAG TPA: hypothetical protein [Caudoviricetes sp.]